MTDKITMETAERQSGLHGREMAGEGWLKCQLFDFAISPTIIVPPQYGANSRSHIVPPQSLVHLKFSGRTWEEALANYHYAKERPAREAAVKAALGL